MEYIIAGLVILLIIAGIIIRNLLIQTESLDDMIKQSKLETIKKIEATLKTMKEIDDRQIFEKDDEVGSAFSDLHNVIKDLYNKI